MHYLMTRSHSETFSAISIADMNFASDMRNLQFISCEKKKKIPRPALPDCLIATFDTVGGNNK